jgi:hypothetical protein
VTRFDREEPTLYTKRNVALAASHLALIMGAQRVVYVGIEQRNAIHFYDTDPTTRAAIRADLETMPDRDLCHRDHPNASFDVLVERLQTPAATLQAQPFYETDHTPVFRDYLTELAALGVEAFSTIPNSVTVDAGAVYRPLGDLL